MKFELANISAVTVIHVQFSNDRTYYHYLQVNFVKDEVVLEKRGQNYTSTKEVAEKLKKDLPLVLHFSGKGVLNRRVKNEDNYRRSILLNGNLDGFYFTDVVNQDFVYSSVVRKDVVNEVIQGFSMLKFLVVRISSGPFISQIIGSIITNKTLSIEAYTLSFENCKIQNFEKSADVDRKSLKLENEQIPYTLISNVCAGLSFFNFNDTILFPTNETLFNANTDEAKQRILFKKFSRILLVFFLVILTGNYFYLGRLNQEIIENTAFLQNYDDQLNRIAKLRGEKARKESLLLNSGITGNDFLSFYLMGIGNSVPHKIVLERLAIRPIQKEVKRKEKIEFNDKQILVFGRTQTSRVLNEWIMELESNDWVETVDIIDYEYDDVVGAFELEMELN